MRYATMRGQGGVTVTIPKLEGGVNLSDLPTQVEDNQLTDARNMWWHQGVLRTRPGLTIKQEGTLQVGATGQVERFVRSHSISEQETLLSSMRRSPDGKAGSFYGYSLDARNGITKLGVRHDVALNADGTWSSFSAKADGSNGTEYYFFLSDGKVLKQGEEKDGLDRELVDAEPYVPHVTVERRNEDGSVSNIKYEDYNMLTPQFKCSFSTDGERCSYSVPESGGISKIITVSITLDGSEAVELNEIKTAGDWIEIAAEKAGEKAQSLFPEESTLEVGYRPTNNNRSVLLVVKKKEDTKMNFWYPPEVTSNNLLITAETNSSRSRMTICRMTKATWFGGARSGLDGGTRLFVTGNPEKPHLVHWSDINNPLYFPENNYFYVGDADQRVTGFGKQGELLIIFKERQLYCSQYVAGSTITKDDLVSGAVTDIAALTAKFPLTPLHPTIGCDCPDTIRLVNNRLVWATSDAHVYMLPSVNQYSERNVRDITALIRRDLEKHTVDELKLAMATEYKGHYVLFIPDGTAYLLDVGNSAFQSYTYYASEKKANRALPWYIWKLDSGADEWVAAVGDGERLCLLKRPLYMPVYGGQEWTLYALEGEDDGGEPIQCSFTTKLFDFGRGDLKKAITHLYIGVADGQPNTVRISYITDAYTAEDAYIIDSGGDHSEREAGYIRTHRLTPNIHRVRLFGVRCDSEGAMAVDGIQIKMKPQGVVR